MNSPFNASSQSESGERMMMIVPPPSVQVQGAEDGRKSANCKPNGDPDYVMLWGDEED